MADYGDDTGSYTDGPASKRMRTDDKDGAPDPHRAPPSPVLHVRGLRETATQDDIIDAVQSFGAVAFVMMLPRKRQALVEFEDIQVATAVVKYSQNNTIYVSGQPAFFNFSTSNSIKRPLGDQGAGATSAENKVLLITVQNPKYPITVDVLHTICSPSGDVVRIVIFKKNGVQAMVEFESAEAAKRAKQSLNGCDIYSGCCTLKIEYAKPERLNVFKNDSESWDYTNPNPGHGAGPGPASNRTLLGDRPPPGVRSGSKFSRDDVMPRGPDSYFGDRYEEGYVDGRGPGGDGRGPGGPARYGGGYDGSSPGLPRSRQAPFSGPADYVDEDEYGGPHAYGDKHHGGGRFGGMPGRGPLTSGLQSPPDNSQQGTVMMVYNMNMDRFNCDRLFNLLCLYGNVIRIKFLKSKEGVAMVQMADGMSVNRAITNLNYAYAFGNKMSMGYSKQMFLQDVVNPHLLADGTSSFKDYMGNRNNRFNSPEAAAKNRITPPTKVLHYFNTPAKISDEELIKVFENAGAQPPSRVKQFPSKSDRSSTGLLEWESNSDALEALIITNHVEIPNPSGKNPYVFKLCFSSSPILERGQ